MLDSDIVKKMAARGQRFLGDYCEAYFLYGGSKGTDNFHYKEI
jgi:hypothetical protein